MLSYNGLKWLFKYYFLHTIDGYDWKNDGYRWLKKRQLIKAMRDVEDLNLCGSAVPGVIFGDEPSDSHTVQADQHLFKIYAELGLDMQPTIPRFTRINKVICRSVESK